MYIHNTHQFQSPNSSRHHPLPLWCPQNIHSMRVEIEAFTAMSLVPKAVSGTCGKWWMMAWLFFRSTVSDCLSGFFIFLLFSCWLSKLLHGQSPEQLNGNPLLLAMPAFSALEASQGSARWKMPAFSVGSLRVYSGLCLPLTWLVDLWVWLYLPFIFQKSMSHRLFPSPVYNG